MLNQDNCKNLVFTREYFEGVPYDVMRNKLYRPEDLYDCYDPANAASFENCYDTRVYRHFLDTGKENHSAMEALSRALHDYSIRMAMQEFLLQFKPGLVAGIMGGHSLLRTCSTYRDIVLISKKLTEQGFLMTSGGGPGAMEATHLGAWMAGRPVSEIDEAIRLMSAAPSFKDEGWLRTAMQVIRLYPNLGYTSMSIPTWLYGHEPATPFATHIAKLFDNSVREDQLLTIAYGGLIFVPGSAGTIQEVFQEAVQEHYLSLGVASPIVFMGKQFWSEEVPVYPFFQHMIDKGRYQNMTLTLTDDIDEAVNAIKANSCLNEQGVSGLQTGI